MAITRRKPAAAAAAAPERSTRRPARGRAPEADDYTPPATEDADEDEFEDEDEDEKSTRSSSMQSGWKAARKAAEAAKKAAYTDDFKPSDEPQIITFLEEGPFAVYRQHWIEREGKRSFVCLKSVGQDACPLCDSLSDSPREQFAFNILNFSVEAEDDEDALEPTVQILTAGPMLLEILSDLDEDKIKGPLLGNYYSVHRTGGGKGKKSKTVYHVSHIKKRDLAEDYGLDAAEADAEVDKAVLYTPDAITVTSAKELRAIAREAS